MENHSPPDTGAHVTAACCEDTPGRARSYRNNFHMLAANAHSNETRLTGILVALQHKLCNTRMRIPELNTTILGTTEHPVAMWGKGNAKDKVL